MDLALSSLINLIPISARNATEQTSVMQRPSYRVGLKQRFCRENLHRAGSRMILNVIKSNLVSGQDFIEQPTSYNHFADNGFLRSFSLEHQGSEMVRSDQLADIAEKRTDGDAQYHQIHRLQSTVKSNRCFLTYEGHH